MSSEIINLDPHAVVREHNGAIFVARKVEDAQKFKIAALIRAGAFHDTIPGIAHFFEHMPFEQSQHFSNDGISQFFIEKGGFINAVTGYDSTIYHGETFGENAKDAVYGIAELVRTASFDAKRVVNEAKTIMTEWARSEMRETSRRFRKFLETILGNQAPHAIIGTPESILSITSDDLEKFHANNYTTDNLIVYMQGNFEQERMLDEAIRQFDLPRGPRNSIGIPTPFCSTTSFTPIPDAIATHTSILLPTRSRQSIGVIQAAEDMCQRILTSPQGKLLTEARLDKRLVYGVDISFTGSLRWTMKLIEFDAFPAKVGEICEIIMRQVSQMATNPDETLFNRIKKNEVPAYEDYLKRNSEKDPRYEVPNILANNTVLPRDSFLESMRALNLEDVSKYAQTFLATGPVSVCYEGNNNPNFPDHNTLMSMRPPARPKPAAIHATNTAQLDKYGISSS
jgi:predicted Zn-dependent peptidase